MSEYVFPRCPHCNHKNTFDLEELRRKSGLAHRAIEETEEFWETCASCGRRFKFRARKG